MSLVSYIRHCLIAGFAFFAMVVVCVGSAHSEELAPMIYEGSYGVLGGCHLEVSQSADGKVSYKTSNSRTNFTEGVEQGLLIHLKYPNVEPEMRFIGFEPPKAREELTIWLRKTRDGFYQPIAYQYVPNYLNAQRKHLNFDKTCYLHSK